MAGKVFELPRPSLSLAESDVARFCCAGCRTAWEVINGLGLEGFYARLTQPPATPDVAKATRTELFDLPEFQVGFVVTQDAGDAAEGWRRAFLALDGVTCYACVWLIDKALGREFPGAASSSINLAGSEMVLDYDPGKIKLSAVVGLLNRLGYGVQPMRGQGMRTARRTREAVRLGVAFFCFMNIMSLAFADYVTPPGEVMTPVFWHLFRAVSLALATISISYGAWPFWRASVAAARQRQVVIDQPLLLGIMAAFFWSAWNTLRGAGPVYFDSIAAVVALVLAGRFVQALLLDRIHRKLVNLEDPAVDFARRQTSDGSYELTGIVNVHAGDPLRVLPGEVFGVKTRLTGDSGQVSLEQLRGEVEWNDVAAGSEVPSGAINGSVMLDGVALEDGVSGYVHQSGRMVDRLMQGKGRLAHASDRMATIFFVALISLAVSVLFYSTQAGIEERVARAVALVLIACPCAFGIAVPLVTGRAFHMAIQSGILFKSQRALEALRDARIWVFDKTGTLTMGQQSVVNSDIRDLGLAKRHAPKLLAACALSSHHAAQAISVWLREKFPEVEPTAVSSVTRFSEIPGKGIVAVVGGIEIELIKAGSDAAGWSSVWHAEGKELVRFSLDDRLVDGVSGVVEALKASGLECGILSGDRQENVDRFAQLFPAGWSFTVNESSPREKLDHVLAVNKKSGRHETPVVMVGNGVNDALAMAGSAVGVAVASASQAARKSADVVMIDSNLKTILDARAIACASHHAVMRCFSFSVAYNVVGGSLAVGGYLSPVMAAVLMPASSLAITAIASLWTWRKAGC